MAGKRLEHWSTLNKDELRRRIDLEIRRTDLSFAEQQLLDAAQERLQHWKEPHKRGSSMKNDDPKPNPEPDPKPETSAPDKAKESKVKRNTSKVRAGKKRSSNKVTKTRQAVTRSRLDPNAKVTKLKANPFRENSESWERTEIVLKASGQTVKTIQDKKGLKPSTLSTLKRKGIIKIG
jgi:hypothetical protein